MVSLLGSSFVETETMRRRSRSEAQGRMSSAFSASVSAGRLDNRVFTAELWIASTSVKQDFAAMGVRREKLHNPAVESRGEIRSMS